MDAVDSLRNSTEVNESKEKRVDEKAIWNVFWEKITKHKSKAIPKHYHNDTVFGIQASKRKVDFSICDLLCYKENVATTATKKIGVYALLRKDSSKTDQLHRSGESRYFNYSCYFKVIACEMWNPMTVIAKGRVNLVNQCMWFSMKNRW